MDIHVRCLIYVKLRLLGLVYIYDKFYMSEDYVPDRDSGTCCAAAAGTYPRSLLCGRKPP